MISIIIPVYNVETYLAECLNSVLRQDYCSWECILIDDGSEDRSGCICDEYAERDNRFKVIHQDNKGVSYARNIGLDHANGEWICFIDSDDAIVDNALSHMLYISKRTNADVCICPIVTNKPLQREPRILTESERKALIWSCLTYRTSEYFMQGFMIDAPHGKLFRSSVINQYGLRYAEELCKSEDALFDAQFYHFSTRIVMDSYPVYKYTINPNSICRTYKFENIPIFAKLLRLEKEFVDQHYGRDSMFKLVLFIRTFIAMEQVLYEAGAQLLPLADRIKALKLFMESKLIRSTIYSTRYSMLEPYLEGRSKRCDLWLIKKRMYCTLCLWIDLCKTIFRCRVTIISVLKKCLRMDQNAQLSSIFHK